MKKLLILSSFLFAVQGMAQAQSNLTLYNIEPLPQMMVANPAKTPDCKWYIGMPVLSSIETQFTSNALSFENIENSLIERQNGLGYNLDLKTLSQSIDKQTFVGLGLNVELLNFGFRLRKSMFTFGITEKVKTRISIPNDILKLAGQGNGGQNLGYDFNFNFGFDVLHTREFAMGYSRKFLNDKLTLGGRLKYIRGLNVIETAKNDLVFTTQPQNFDYDLTADIEMNVSSVGLSLNEQSDPTTLALGSRKNSGFGLDIGGVFDLTKRIQLSASIVDMGLIRWAEDVRNLKSKNPGATFTYRGIDLNNYIGDSARGFDVLVDTLVDVFALDTTRESFTTTLFSEFYLGGNFRLNDRHNAGILFYGTFYNRQLNPAMTISWNSKLTRVFAVSLSYSMTRGNFQNLGMGFVTHLGPEQFYFVSDNAIGAFTGNVKNLGIRFGWNHVFGRKKLERERRAAQNN